MIGKVLGNRYTVVEKIGEGGMAIVYKAKCSLLNRFVAIKVLRREFINDEEFIEKFRREAQAAASLSHANIVNIYDVGKEDEDIYYIVMEYIDGKTLKDIIKEKGKMTTEETIKISMKVVDALSHAHENKVIHRDIKPHNIMVTSDGRVKVTDFGIARAATSSTITSTNSVMGSAHYFSPEQARGGYTDEKSDIYSVGIMMYEMATGTLPFTGESPVSIAIKQIQEDVKPPTEVDPNISKNLESIIMKCVEKTQSDRYKDAEELLRDLKDVKNGNSPRISNLDSSATQVLPILDDTVLMKKEDTVLATDNSDQEIKDEEQEELKGAPIVNRTKDKPKKKSKKNKSNKLIAVSAMILALLVVLLGTAVALNLRGAGAEPEIVIPDLIGMTEEEARQELEDIGLRLNVIGTRESDQEKGLVAEQLDKPDKKVKKDYSVKVVISSGKSVELLSVPDLIGKTIDEAEEILKEKGLSINKVSYEDSNKEQDTIISQSPESGSDIEEGSGINVVLSRGKQVKTYKTPDVVGLNEEAAKRLLQSAGLLKGNVTSAESSEERGKIISQNPKAGIAVEEGTQVELVVSKGPKDNEDEKRKEEEERKKAEEEAAKQKEEEEAKQKEEEEERQEIRYEDISLQGSGETVNVKVVKEQDGSSIIVYNQPHAVADGQITLRVKGKPGKAVLRIYMDERAVENRSISF